MSQTISQDRGVLSLIRDAVRGEAHYDFTQERIGRAITLLAIPMVLEMMMESLFAVVDMFWVAHLGADAVATVGLTEAVLTILFTIAMGLSIATTAMVARRIGEKNPKEAAEVAVQAMLLGVIVAGIIGLAGAWFAEDVLRLMGASASIVRTGSGYTRVIYASSVGVMLLFLINAVFRGAGDAVLAMRVLWIGNLINIVLNPLLIFGLGPFPKLGVIGSAAGTTIGPVDRRDDRDVAANHRPQPRGGPRSSCAIPRRDDGAPGADVGRRNFSIFRRRGQLDRDGPDGGVVRQRGGGGIHRGHPHHHLRDSAKLGHGQRGRNPGGPEPGREKTGASRTIGVARRILQHDFPGTGGGHVHHIRRAADRIIHHATRRWFPSRSARCASSVAATSFTPGGW